jgi:hypothetical protein
MIPFEWQAQPQAASPMFEIAVQARDVGPRALLRPSTDEQLATQLDRVLTNYVSELAADIASANAPLMAVLRRSDFREAATLTTSINRAVLHRAVVDDRFELPSVGLPLASIEAMGFEILATKINIVHGSVIAKVAGTFIGAGAGLSLALFVGQPFANQIYSDWRTDREIVRTTSDGQCAIEFAAELNVDEMRKLAVASLQKKAGATAEEEMRRVCVLQALLYLNAAFPGEIDGIEGPKTVQAKKAFAAKSGIKSSSLESYPFYQALLAGVQPKR